VLQPVVRREIAHRDQEPCRGHHVRGEAAVDVVARHALAGADVLASGLAPTARAARQDRRHDDRLAGLQGLALVQASVLPARLDGGGHLVAQGQG
jgi:hypothetical protein